MLRPDELNLLARMLAEQTGNVLEASRAYVAEQRVTELAQTLGLRESELLTRLARDPNGPLAQRLCHALLNGETSFFRDVHAFRFLRDFALPALVARRRTDKRLRIWSAACSTGQEPYSVLMLLLAHFPECQDWDVSVLATDLSEERLAEARASRFSHHQVNRGLPAGYLIDYFQEVDERWAPKQLLRERVRFERLNLIDAWTVVPPIDLVLLRNILIYFDLETRRDVLEKTHRVLAPDGYLILGATESTFNLHDGFAHASSAGGCFARIPSLLDRRHAPPSH